MKINTKKLSKNYNVSDESDMKRLFRYAGYFFGSIIAIYTFFLFLSYAITYIVSLEDEARLFDGVGSMFGLSDMPQNLQERYKDIEYPIKVIDMDGEINAFADLGGRVYITQELLDSIKYHETLDFVIGHEVSHIENRDVLRGLISRTPFTLIFALFSPDTGLVLFDILIANPHSKIVESRADREGVDYVFEKNGHIGCVSDFFEDQSVFESAAEVFSTHPITPLRVARIQKYVQAKQYEVQDCSKIEL